MKQNKKNISFLIKQYEFAVTTAIVLVVVFLLVIKLLIPNLIKISQINSDSKKLKANIQLVEKKDKILTTIDDGNLQNNFVKLNYVMPASKDYVLLFSTLDELQKKTGVEITRTDFELGTVSTTSGRLKKNNTSNSNMIPISFEILGTIDQIRLFINSLSDLSGRLITINSIKLEVSEIGLVKASMNGNTYYNPLPKTLGKVESPIPEFNKNYEEIFKSITENQYPVEVISETGEDIQIGKENLFL